MSTLKSDSTEELNFRNSHYSVTLKYGYDGFLNRSRGQSKMRAKSLDTKQKKGTPDVVSTVIRRFS